MIHTSWLTLQLFNAWIPRQEELTAKANVFGTDGKRAGILRPGSTLTSQAHMPHLETCPTVVQMAKAFQMWNLEPKEELQNTGHDGRPPSLKRILGPPAQVVPETGSLTRLQKIILQ